MQAKSDARTLMLEQLSDWLLQRREQLLWRELFLANRSEMVSFGEQAVTLVAADCPLEWGGEHAEFFASRFGGHAQATAEAELLMVFERPGAALRAALALQRTSDAQPLRVAMTTGARSFATVPRAGSTRRVYFGPAVEHAERLVADAARGTLLLCADSYGALQHRLAVEAPEAVIATELIGEQVTSASVILPPPQASQLSTFAGLGLT